MSPGQIWSDLILAEKFLYIKKASEYDMEIQQSQSADQPTAPFGRAT